jgi:hypothetical protein
MATLYRHGLAAAVHAIESMADAVGEKMKLFFNFI